MDGIDFISQVIKFIYLNEILEKNIWRVVLTVSVQMIRINRIIPIIPDNNGKQDAGFVPIWLIYIMSERHSVGPFAPFGLLYRTVKSQIIAIISRSPFQTTALQVVGSLPGGFSLEVLWPLLCMVRNTKKNSCWQVLLVWSWNLTYTAAIPGWWRLELLVSGCSFYTYYRWKNIREQGQINSRLE